MGTNYGGKPIPTTGLLLALDAANPHCFGTGQTSATNIVSGEPVTGANGNPGTGAHTPNTANFPAYNSVNGGVFDFAGGRGMNVDEDLGSHTAFTLSMWFYTSSATLAYFTDGRNDGGTWYIRNYSTSINYEFAQQLSYNYDVTYDASAPEFTSTWVHQVVVSDATESRLYLNGTEVSTYVSQTSVNESLGVNYRIGTRFTTSNEWTGYMGPIFIYDNVLSQANITALFEAHRDRFGV
jgi:hypothetical protein